MFNIKKNKKYKNIKIYRPTGVKRVQGGGFWGYKTGGKKKYQNATKTCPKRIKY